MAGRVKTYGPAAAAEPRELLLAKLLQNGHARGLKWTRGAEFRAGNGKAIDVYDETVVSCCAAGAASLEPDTNDELGSLFRVELGNDATDFESWDGVRDYNGQLVLTVPANDGEDLGRAFREAFR